MLHVLAGESLPLLVLAWRESAKTGGRKRGQNRANSLQPLKCNRLKQGTGNAGPILLNGILSLLVGL